MPDFSAITAAAAALNALTAQEAAEKAGIDASVAAALKAIQQPLKVVYLDAVAGLDSQDGSTPARAVQTPQAAAALVGAGQFGVITLLSDVVLAAPLVLGGSFAFASNNLAVDGTGGGTMRTITVLPSAVAGGVGGQSFAINHVHGPTLAFQAVKLAIGALTAATAAIGTVNKITLNDAVVTFDPGQSSPLVYGVAGASAFFINTSLPANAAGRIFAGVAAGQNPNTPGLRTNLTYA